MGWKQSRERNRRLKRLYRIPCRDFRGVHYNERKKRLVRYYIGSRSAFLRKISNRKVRRSKAPYGNHSGYRKVFDYWWELY